jgi:hypothetical protein
VQKLLVSIAIVWAGAASMVHAQGAVAPSRPKPFEVLMTGLAALPQEPPDQGVAKACQDGDVVYSMPVAHENRAIATAPIKFRVGGVDWTIPEKTELVRASEATGGDLASLPTSAVIYCGEEFKRSAESVAFVASLGLSGFVTRFSLWLQLCVVDTDLDGKFDKAFLSGAKSPSDLSLVDLTP